ncbi:MAG: GlmU family protein [Flavisolibacter sp.]
MKKIVFTEEFCQPENLLPFTLTRRIQDIRVGLLTIREKWELFLGIESFDQTAGDYKDGLRSITIDQQIGKDIIYLVHANILPSVSLVKKLKKLQPGECISLPKLESIIYCISRDQVLDSYKIRVNKSVSFEEKVCEINWPWDIIRQNKEAIEQDIALLKHHRKLQQPSKSNHFINKENVYMEKGVIAEHCSFNASEGPIYIEKNAVLMEGCLLRGPIAIGEAAVLKMGSKIYGATTIGPKCLVGGEIKNSIFFDHSNKAHDGYIGDAVIGAWCNLGAGTSNSNIKNNASSVMVWTKGGIKDAGIKCGTFIGDYTRTAINTSINTGTVMGVAANVFGLGLTPKYIPNFSWGSEGIQRYRFEKSLLDIKNWMQLKEENLTDREKVILKHIFDQY